MTNDRFRNRLEIDFGNMPAITRHELANLMRQYGYRKKKRYREDDVYRTEEPEYDHLEVKQTQLNAAWDHLQDYYKKKR